MRDHLDIEDCQQFPAPVTDDAIPLLRRHLRQDEGRCQQSAENMQNQVCGAQQARELARISLVQRRSES